jgi:hypothetical protein
MIQCDQPQQVQRTVGTQGERPAHKWLCRRQRQGDQSGQRYQATNEHPLLEISHQLHHLYFSARSAPLF